MDVPGLNCVIPVTLKVMLMLKRQPCADLIPAAAALQPGMSTEMKLLYSTAIWLGMSTEIKLLLGMAILLLLGTN